ncbi:serine threonine-protein kinase rio1 [Ophiostoma piceae UAMH 11346]|uniref:Serine/threonine-protein kinase RIO1 n=1 Tax=Ophiostoma piceae (strain UAMH 11346) TaxID=1262450 RepID=S3CUN9_OPHP1|nr:serine threonine-protein kinase rio1 [Ophiostoma piceae UAMH 11346]
MFFHGDSQGEITSNVKTFGQMKSGDGRRIRDKSDRATRDQVLDPRTQSVLVQLINRDLISEVHGVISTGKEANVYTAVLNTYDDEGSPTGQEFRAAKIYKTSILSFVDRDRYIVGEHRFRGGEHKGNNRKMVKKWAEKEFRNLQRLHRAGIPCPFPIQLKINVLLMSFLGDNGAAYPRLQDAVITPDKEDLDAAEADETEEDAGAASVARQWYELYVQLLGLMRQLYQECRLVHADLSEFNVLYHEHTLYMIDVSQSVSFDHPHALEFLRMDIRNVNTFFRKKGVDTLRDRTVYDFIQQSTPSVEEVKEKPDVVAEVVEELYASRPVTEDSAKARAEIEVDNEVFHNQYIPQSLMQVYDPEMVARGSGPLGADGADHLDAKDTLYSNMLVSKKGDENEDGEDDNASETSEDSTGSGVSLQNSDIDDKSSRPRGKRFEDKDTKKAHKQSVKEQHRLKRAEKMPKKMKKKLVSRTSTKK